MQRAAEGGRGGLGIARGAMGLGGREPQADLAVVRGALLLVLGQRPRALPRGLTRAPLADQGLDQQRDDLPPDAREGPEALAPEPRVLLRRLQGASPRGHPREDSTRHAGRDRLVIGDGAA